VFWRSRIDGSATWIVGLLWRVGNIRLGRIHLTFECIRRWLDGLRQAMQPAASQVA
jgi:hypothetical protein